MDSSNITYKYDDTHWAHALETAYQRDVDFIVGSGDYIENKIDYPGIGTDEWRRYQRILAESNYCNPIYEAIGNHELWQSVSGGTADFIKATGLEGNTSSAGKAYYEKTICGDHFIFMALEGGFYPDRTNEFTDAQLNWLRGLLQSYSGDGHNIYIIEHSLFRNWGAGDKLTGEPYYDIPLSSGSSYPNHERFKNMLKTYKDVIFISGHTHISFAAQFNYSDNGGTSAQTVHNSSVGGIRKIINGSMDRNYQEDETEGYIVDVYPDAILFNGTDLYYNRIDPNYCYILKTAAQIDGVEPPTAAPATAAPTTAAPTEPPVQQTTAAATTAPVTAAPTTAAPTAAPTTSGFTPVATAYYLKGSFNSWGSSNRFYTTQTDYEYETTVQLAAGTYTFKINANNTWWGNSGTIRDTTKATSNGGWVMETSAGDCTLVASGGTYTFNFNVFNNKLNVLYTPATRAKSVEALGSNKTYYLFGYINGADYACEGDYANMGTYKITNGTLSATFSQDSYVAVKEENNANWYMTNGYPGNEATSATLYNTSITGQNSNKLRVPANTPVTFTLTENADGSLTLSYSAVTPTTAAPAAEAPTTAPVSAAAVGDVDADGRIDIIDATMVQRYIVNLETLSASQITAADANLDGEVTVVDVTEIQKYIAGIITEFGGETPEPATVPATVAPTTAPATVEPTTDGVDDAEKTALMEQVSGNLSKYYRYASYDNYQALKKAYKADAALISSGNIAQVNASELQTLQSALLAIVDTSNVDPATTMWTVYFEDNRGWGNIHAYVWGNNGAGSPVQWPGAEMTRIGSNESGKSIYRMTVNAAVYNNVIFNNGSDSNKTADIRLTDDNVAYYISGDTYPYAATGYAFNQSYITGN